VQLEVFYSALKLQPQENVRYCKEKKDGRLIQIYGGTTDGAKHLVEQFEPYEEPHGGYDPRCAS